MFSTVAVAAVAAFAATVLTGCGDDTVPKPEMTTTPKPEATTPKPEATTKPKPEETTVPKPEMTTTPKPKATTPAPKPEATTKPKPEATTKPKPEETTPPKPEVKPKKNCVCQKCVDAGRTLEHCSDFSDCSCVKAPKAEETYQIITM